MTKLVAVSQQDLRESSNIWYSSSDISAPAQHEIAFVVDDELELDTFYGVCVICVRCDT